MIEDCHASRCYIKKITKKNINFRYPFFLQNNMSDSLFLCVSLFFTEMNEFFFDVWFFVTVIFFNEKIIVFLISFSFLYFSPIIIFVFAFIKFH